MTMLSISCVLPAVADKPLSTQPTSLLPVLVPSRPSPKVPKMLIFIDFRDFMCPACLDSLLEICRSFPKSFLQKQTTGIVLLNETQNPSSRHLRITRKKINGFIHANRIEFPILLDRGKSRKISGTQIWVLCPTSKELIRYELPLSTADLNSLCRLVFTKDFPV